LRLRGFVSASAPVDLGAIWRGLAARVWGNLAEFGGVHARARGGSAGMPRLVVEEGSAGGIGARKGGPRRCAQQKLGGGSAVEWPWRTACRVSAASRRAGGQR
jgi:hypothetical protein